MCRKRNLIIAHRGESYDAPENTLAAINLAWERDADAVEIDIQLSRDNNIVVIHDTNTKRTSGENKDVKSQTLKELRELDVGCYKDKKWKGEKIPTLVEVLGTIPDDKKLILEIKCDSEIINIMVPEIRSSGLQPEQIGFISFDLSTIAQIKKVLPEYNALWLSALDFTWLRKIFHPSIDKLITRTIDNNLNGLGVWAGNMINNKLVKKIKTAGLILYVWTVNDPIKAQQLIDIGVDGITTDKAQWLTKNLPIRKN